MAIVVIGGLVTSTFLSLLVIPVLFTYVDDVVQWLRRLTGRRGTPSPLEAHP
jgi:Cu/Ag efflux pump CusA